MDTSKIYMFKNVNSQIYMNVAGGSTDDGTNIQQWGGDPAEPQTYNSFTLKAFSGGGNYYYIMSRLGNYCLKAESGSNGGNISLSPYSTKDRSMLFRFVKNPDGSYDILTHASKEACLVEIADASKNVFSTGGKIFDGIKDGIVSAFITVEVIETNDESGYTIEPKFEYIEVN